MYMGIMQRGKKLTFYTTTSVLVFVFLEFIQMATSFEACRKKWLQADEALGSCKEVLAKAETDRGSLEVKLKHARNQVDVEIRRRQKAEAEYEKLVGSFTPFFRELLCIKSYF